MSATVTNIYRATPGESGFPVWDSFAEDGGGLYLVSGGSYTGKTTFAKATAIEAGAHLGVALEELIFVHLGEREAGGPNVLNYPGNVYDYTLSREEQDTVNEEFIAKVLRDVAERKAKIVVIDDIRSVAAAKIAVQLYLQGCIVFGVFESSTSKDVVKHFEQHIFDGENPAALLERPVYIAALTLFFERDIEDNVRREGFVEYREEVLSIPFEVK